MRFKETEKRGKQRWIARPFPQLFSPDSGQIKKSLRPPRITERCCKGSERESDGIIVVFARHGLQSVEAG